MSAAPKDNSPETKKMSATWTRKSTAAVLGAALGLTLYGLPAAADQTDRAPYATDGAERADSRRDHDEHAADRTPRVREMAGEQRLRGGSSGEDEQRHLGNVRPWRGLETIWGADHQTLPE